MSWSLAIHGGAEPVSLSEDREQYRTELAKCLDRGAAVLSGKSSPSFSPYTHLNVATQAVIESVIALEDCDLFNSGCGSCFNCDGELEMDAQVADNRGHCGACTGLTRIRNPILAAERVMSETKHALITSPSAEKFAVQQGLRTEPFEYFHTERRWKQYEAGKMSDNALPKPSEGGHNGTVGATAKDADGNIACAVSTGGTTNKMLGRVGDSPLFGAGCYVTDKAGVCGTGRGEVFLYKGTCNRICAAMDYGGLSLDDACEKEMGRLSVDDGGVIAVDCDGGIFMDFTTQAMPRAMLDSSGRRGIAVWKEWEECNF